MTETVTVQALYKICGKESWEETPEEESLQASSECNRG